MIPHYALRVVCSSVCLSSLFMYNSHYKNVVKYASSKTTLYWNKNRHTDIKISDKIEIIQISKSINNNK